MAVRFDLAVVATALALACGGSPGPGSALPPARNPLACAGHTLEDVVPIPALGLLPSGEPVTAGTALTCTADALRVMDWGPDSSQSFVVSRGSAMALWSAFQLPGTHDERRQRILVLLARDAASAAPTP